MKSTTPSRMQHFGNMYLSSLTCVKSQNMWDHGLKNALAIQITACSVNHFRKEYVPRKTNLGGLHNLEGSCLKRIAHTRDAEQSSLQAVLPLSLYGRKWWVTETKFQHIWHCLIVRREQNYCQTGNKHVAGCGVSSLYYIIIVLLLWVISYI